jgi:DeoR family fructose operon transcriptional repressor
VYATERHQYIVSAARRVGRVDVAALAEALGVTAETVRRDLTLLERRGTLHRVHGGAIPVERIEAEPALATRATRKAAEKRRIAARALDELTLGSSVLLDSGSTTHAIARLFPATGDFTVVTNSLDNAGILAARTNVDVLLIGGHLRNTTGATVGDWATEALAGVTVEVAFLGTNGLTTRGGLTTPNQAEAAVKRAMVKAARRVVLVTDASKVGVDHLHRFADLDVVDLILTDTSLDADLAAEIEAQGPEVVRT